MDINDFIAEIIHNPHDDTPRMIFADYLEEQGDPRAEMIRLQFQLAEISPFDRQRQKLRARELQLLRKHGGFGSVPKGVKATESHGGFIDGIEVTVARFLKLQDEIFTQAPIRHVTLKSHSKFFVKLCDSPHLDKIGHLTLRSNDASSAELIELLKQPALSNLKTLEFRGGTMEARVLEYLSSAPHFSGLQQLLIWTYGMHARGGMAIANSSTLDSLRTLSLSAVDEDVAQQLARSPVTEHLEELDVRGQMGCTGIRRLQAGPYCRNLEKLSIYSVNNDRDGDCFSVRPPLPKLKHLTVGEQFPGEILNGIVASYPDLETLDLTRNRIENHHVRVLAESRLLKKLDKLVLTANDIGSEGVHALANSPHRNKRTKLYLRSNPIPKDQIKEIKEQHGKTFGNFGKEEWNHRYD